MLLTGQWSSGMLRTIRESGAQFSTRHLEVKWLGVSDLDLSADHCYLYEHAAAGEPSLPMAIHPELVGIDPVFETGTSLQDNYISMPEHFQRRKVAPHKYISVLIAATDSSNDPEHARVDRGSFLFETIFTHLAQRARVLLAECNEEIPK